MNHINSNLQCNQHPSNCIEFLQIKEIDQNEEDKSLFYCTLCVNEDISFKGVNYIPICQIINVRSSEIISKWPPTRDPRIIDQLIKISSIQHAKSQVENEIIYFFSSLKSEIAQKIDEVQKKIITELKNNPMDERINNSIIKRYQQISKICELQALLSNNQLDLKEKAIICRDIIISMSDKIEQNTKDLFELIEQIEKQKCTLNLELPNKTKQTVLDIIDSFDFFSSEIKNNNNQQQPNNHNNKNNPKVSDQIFKLIANKSNRCSDQFLAQIELKLNQLQNFFSSISLESQLEERKKPIDFSELTKEQLDIIEQQVNHFSQPRNKSDKLNERKKTYQNNNVLKIIQNKNNSPNLSDKYLLDTCHQNIMMKSVNQQDILPTMKLIKGQYNNGYVKLIINKLENNQKEIFNRSESDTNCVSNFNLEPNKKYVFRFSINQQNSKSRFLIGLMREERIHQSGGFEDYLSCHLAVNKNTIQQHSSTYGMSYQKKGERLISFNESLELELRVCLEDSSLEITDFPNQQFIIVLEEKYKYNLMSFKNLRLYIGQVTQDFKIILKEAQIMNNFNQQQLSLPLPLFQQK